MPDRAQIVSGVKLLFRVAQEGLKGIGTPGVEAIAGVPLLLIEIYEVNPPAVVPSFQT